MAARIPRSGQAKRAAAEHSRRHPASVSEPVPAAVYTAPDRRAGWDRSWCMRLLSFACTGGVAALCQMATLLWLLDRGWPPVASSALAFLAGAQVNFILSCVITWRGRASGSWRRRWMLYHGAVAITVPLNVLTFDATRHLVPIEVAGALGLAVAGLANYMLADRLVFARPRSCMAPAR